MTHDGPIHTPESSPALGWTAEEGWIETSCPPIHFPFFQERGHEISLDDDLALDQSSAMKLQKFALELDKMSLKPELIAGDNGLSKPRVFDFGQKHEFGLGIRDGMIDKDAAGLSDGFDDEHAWHDPHFREMSLEKRLIVGDIFQGDDRLSRLHAQNAVDEKKGIAVGKNLQDPFDVDQGTVPLFAGGFRSVVALDNVFGHIDGRVEIDGSALVQVKNDIQPLFLAELGDDRDELILNSL